MMIKTAKADDQFPCLQMMTLTGVIRSPMSRIEERRRTAANVGLNLLTLPLRFPIQIIAKPPKLNSAARRVDSFLLEVENPTTFTHLSVEMSGPQIEGLLRAGDYVEVDGDLHDRRGVFMADEVRSLRTGERIKPTLF